MRKGAFLKTTSIAQMIFKIKITFLEKTTKMLGLTFYLIHSQFLITKRNDVFYHLPNGKIITNDKRSQNILKQYITNKRINKQTS